MRVMISMDTHSHVDGASKVHTIKRYLSEHKDESIINNSGLRCRELDCLRAYYYVTILNFLKESCFTGEATEVTFTKESSQTRESTVSGDNESSKSDLPDQTLVKEVQDTVDNISGGQENPAAHDDSGNHLCSSDSKKANSSAKLHQPSNSETNSNCDTKFEKDENLPDTNETVSNSSLVALQANELSADLSPPSEKVVTRKRPSSCQTKPVLNVNHYRITVSRLSRLAQGLLWDLQAKRYALTETLGYIHKAISQLLLSKNSQSSSTQAEAGASEGQGTNPLSDNQSVDANTETSTGTRDSGLNAGKSDPAGSAKVESRVKPSENSATGGDEGAVAMATELATKSGSSPSAGPVGEDFHHMCEHISEHIEGHLCHSALSHHFDQMLNIHVPHIGEVPVHECLSETETELKCSFFEVCSSCELLQKSRKILFEDEPHFHSRPEVKDVTNITNPAKYINVPDEWYGMPVDQKYFKRYITMAILKDEQEYVMGELKRGPDNTQVLTLMGSIYIQAT